MEMPNIDTSKFNPIIEELLLRNKSSNVIFKKTPFSEYVIENLRKNFYDYINPYEATAITKVQIVQNNHVGLCLDESHFVSNFTKYKGEVKF